MIEHVTEMEGTWEEIAAHAPELIGRRLHVTVLPDGESTAPGHKQMKGLLAIFDGLESEPDAVVQPPYKDYVREGRSGAMWGYDPSDL